MVKPIAAQTPRVVHDQHDVAGVEPRNKNATQAVTRVRDGLVSGTQVLSTDPRQAAVTVGAALPAAPQPSLEDATRLPAEMPSSPSTMVGDAGSVKQARPAGRASGGASQVDVPDPTPRDIELSYPKGWNRKERLNGSVYVNGTSPREVFQGGIGDCYLAASVSAVAATRPELASKLVTPNADGTATVHLRKFSEDTGLYEPVDVKVDSDFYLTSNGTVRFGWTQDDSTVKSRGNELWWPMVEKAYAVMKGNSYEKIDHGGDPARAMSELTGAWSDTHRLEKQDAKEAQDVLLDATAKRLPVVAWTHGDEARYDGTGLSAHHAYTVLGAERTASGEVVVRLRNPNGAGEPAGNGTDDGEFTLPFNLFQAQFYSYAVNRLDQL